jgi:tripartite-type tricarboxylate transporter receptor subunit TctC
MKPRTALASFLLAGLVAALAILSAAPTAQAQAPYPNRPVRLIIPFPPGGPTDVMGRLIAQHLSGVLGQQVLPDNRPGAGGTLAGRVVATAQPDGYTLLLCSSGVLAIGPALYGNIGYDPLKSFAPIAMVSEVSYVMIAGPRAPFNNVRELLAYAKANPGKLNLGVPNGAQPHVLALAFNALTGADIVVVPYKGAANAMTDMMGGQIDGGIETNSVVLAHLKERSLKALGVIRDRRLPELPDTPTLIESGVPDLKGASWTGVLAPLGTPQPIIDKLRAEIIAGLKSPAMVDKFEKLGAEAKFPTPSEFAAYIADENKRLAAIIRAAGVKAE